MLRYPCLVLDHDDTVVKSESTVNYPYFCKFLDQFRPGTCITLQEYTEGCYTPGFTEMCRQKYHFTQKELEEEYKGWMAYVSTHIPAYFPGIERIIRRQKQEGGIICVVSHSSQINIRRDYMTHFHIVPDEIYGWELPPSQRKPSPYPLYQIMAHHHVSPEEILVVDDMKPALQMCRAAGVPIGFAAWSHLENPVILQEMSQSCDYTFRCPAELEAFLF